MESKAGRGLEFRCSGLLIHPSPKKLSNLDNGPAAGDPKLPFEGQLLADCGLRFVTPIWLVTPNARKRLDVCNSNKNQ